MSAAVSDKVAVERAYELARGEGVAVRKPPRTTWLGVSRHKPWIEDPDGNLVQAYTRLTDEEFATGLADLELTPLV